MLVRCVYASRAKAPEDAGIVAAILRESRRKNETRGVTGMLLLVDGVYVQVLEGGRAEVSSLLASILADPRHYDASLISFEEILERRFGSWTMGEIDVNGVNGAMILRYSATTRFDPFTSNAAATIKLLEEIADSGNVVCRAK
jgi:hypothetical protein